MKKKIFVLVTAVLMLAVMLTGCIQTDIGVKIDKKDGGSISATLGIEKDFYDMLKENGSDPFEGKETVEYTYEDSTYVSYTEVKNYDSYEQMEKALLDMTYNTELIEDAENAEEGETDVDNSELTVDAEPEAPAQDNHIFSTVNIEKNGSIFSSSYTFNAVMNPQRNEDESDYDVNDIFKVTLSVGMPDEITEYEGGTVEGNKITFDITDITESQEFSATCETSNAGAVVGVVAIVLVVVIVGAFIFMKVKGNQER